MALKLSVVVASLILVCVVAMLLLPLAIRHDPSEHLIKIQAETSSLGRNRGVTPTSVGGDTDDKKIYLKSLADKTGFKAAPDGGLSSGQNTSSNSDINDDGAPVDISALDPTSVAIIQFDSRKLVLTGGSGESNYWTASALWNKYYCTLHRHKFLYYTLEGGSGQCKSHTGEVLADPWCKVKAMLEADKQHVDVKLFVYMDSDAVLDRNFANRPLQELLGVMQTKLSWKPHEKPTVFNQDGPCWWCDLVESKGYSMCLNAGTVVWYRHPRSRATLTAWWESAMDPYKNNPIKRAFRTKWPWEQDRQMALYAASPDHIQVATQPEKLHMDMRAGHHDWCLSHLARSGCFISHYCEGSHSKLQMKERYEVSVETGMPPDGGQDIDISDSMDKHLYFLRV